MDDMMAEAEKQMNALRDKLRAAMDEGPDGKPVILSPTEATVCYRLLFGDARNRR